MGTGMTYFDMAENDYQFLQFDYENGRVGNVMCYVSQNVCERYLKHLIDIYCDAMNTTHILKTHSLRVLKKFIKSNLRDFCCNWDTVIQADGFYFSARYPGEDSFMVDRDDVNDCWEAVKETRKAVVQYLENHTVEKIDISKDDGVIKELKSF